MNDAGKRIRQRRELLGMTQEELAHKVGYASRVSINKIELARDIPVKRLKPIADALEISVGDLMGWEEEEQFAEGNEDVIAEVINDKELFQLVKDIETLSPDKRKSLRQYADFLLSQS